MNRRPFWALLRTESRLLIREPAPVIWAVALPLIAGIVTPLVPPVATPQPIMLAWTSGISGGNGTQLICGTTAYSA